MRFAFPIALSSMLLTLSGPAYAEGDAKKGQPVFTQRCIYCHATACNRSGPMLGGIIGRKAAVAPGYPYYSTALKNSDVVWSEAVLDKMVASPETFLPGWGMSGNPLYFGKIDDAAQPQDLIAFLKSGDTSLDLCPR
jgi:cytochrome c